MQTISPDNSWTVGRRLTVEDPINRRQVPLTTATLYARVYADEDGTVDVGIAQITLSQPYDGEYRGVFNMGEVNAALPTYDGVDLYEVVWSSDGRYRDVAKIRVNAARTAQEA